MASSRLFAAEFEPKDADAIKMVQTLAAHIAKDAPGAFKAVDSKDPAYCNKDNPEFYAFAYDITGTVVCHPHNPKLIGTNYVDRPDPTGKLFRKEILQIANDPAKGKGWVDYTYTKPGDKKLHKKNTYFERVKGSDGKDYIPACGIYMK
ncbi:MAG: hypothetical protein A2Y14_00615 [Verrucomicrobia bacterium GWF2_51_19]|nr:MAG: hypothetical protein A2Y14_00615 [Verrucomicrobia bacterium GWF2_51_19]